MIILKGSKKYNSFRILFLKLAQNCRNVKGFCRYLGYSVVR
jgi:hypothetical protein